MNDSQLYDTLHLDPIGFAEQVTGSSYKDDPDTLALGFGILQDQAKLKERVLTARGDTTFRNKLDRYVRIITDYGFRLVLDVPFEMEGYGRDGVTTTEHLFVYWHDDGLLLAFTTYQETNVNGGNVYYAWEPNDWNDPECWRCTSSHEAVGDDNVILGYHDCREALIFNLEQLRKHGRFLNPFPRAPRLWLAHYGPSDKKDHREPGFCEHYERIRQERAALLPDDVREALRL